MSTERAAGAIALVLGFSFSSLNLVLTNALTVAEPSWVAFAPAAVGLIFAYALDVDGDRTETANTDADADGVTA